MPMYIKVKMHKLIHRYDAATKNVTFCESLFFSFNIIWKTLSGHIVTLYQLHKLQLAI